MLWYIRITQSFFFNCLLFLNEHKANSKIKAIQTSGIGDANAVSISSSWLYEMVFCPLSVKYSVLISNKSSGCSGRRNLTDARKSGKGAVIKASLSYSQWKFGIAPGTNFPAYNFSTRSRACHCFFPTQTLCKDRTNDFKADNTSLCFPSVVPLK